MNHWMHESSLRRPVASDDLEDAWRGALVLEVDPEGRLPVVDGTPVALDEPGHRGDGDVALGRFHDRYWFARPVDRLRLGPSGTLRDVADPYQEPVCAAVALVRWHAGALHCERCGALTFPQAGGIRRACPVCGLLVFPRQDPAVIVAVLDPRDRLLLASQRTWPPDRVSVVAGFVEAGESLEQACWREVAEEVGIELDSVAFVSSQPWPMPRSLMLGFVARTSQDEVTPDGEEIAWGRFFTREELTAALAAGDLRLPGPASIARLLIDRWLQGTLAVAGVTNG